MGCQHEFSSPKYQSMYSLSQGVMMQRSTYLPQRLGYFFVDVYTLRHSATKTRLVIHTHSGAAEDSICVTCVFYYAAFWRKDTIVDASIEELPNSSFLQDIVQKDPSTTHMRQDAIDLLYEIFDISPHQLLSQFYEESTF